MVPRLSARDLSEGALLAALVALLAIASRYLPPVAVVAPLVCPLPLTLLVMRHGLRLAVIAALVAAALGVLLAGPLVGATLLLTFAPLGIALGVGIRQRRSAQMIVLMCSIVATLSLLGNLGLTLAIAGVNPYTVMFEGMQQGVQEGATLYTRLGYSPAQIEQVTAPFRRALDLMPRLIPLFLVLGGVLSAWINYQVGRLVLHKLGQELPVLPPMTTWRVPMVFLWLLVVGLGLSILAQAALAPLGLSVRILRMLPPDDLVAILQTATSRYPGVETAGLNLLSLSQVLFGFQGFLVGWVLMERYRLPRWYRWGIIGLGMVAPAGGLIAYLLGLADTAFRLRQRWVPAMEAVGVRTR